MRTRIAIVGAGPAGSSLAIRLAQRNFDVVLIEREKFPRHKLCGEFISPECFSHFAELGVLDKMLAAGGEHIIETRFYATGGKSAGVPSSWFNGGGFALSLSRAEMDLRLLEGARVAGAEIFQSTNVIGIEIDGKLISALKVRDLDGRNREIAADVFIDASGRSRVLSRFLEKQAKAKSSPKNVKSLIGFKSHFKNSTEAPGRCEIFFFRDGYGGLSPVEDGKANLCFLIMSAAAREFGADADKILENVIFKNKRAFETLRDAARVREWLAVSIDRFGINSPSSAPNLFSAGDSAAFIDPFTGSGMLMAFESSKILDECLASGFSADGRVSELYIERYREKFAARLRFCSRLRNAAFMPHLAKAAISTFGRSERILEFFTRHTRSGGL